MCGLGPRGGMSIQEPCGVTSWRLEKAKYYAAYDYFKELPSEYQLGETYLVLHLIIGVYKDNVVVMKEPGLYLSIDSSEQAMHQFTVFYTRGRERIRNPIDPRYYHNVTTDIPIDKQSGYTLEEETYLAEIWLDIDRVDTIHVERFDVEVNGEQVEIGPIEFVKKIGAGFFSINC